LKCSSYRPISLLNTDYKLISNALANRLGHCLPKLINPDQCGFISKRSSANNLCRLFNIIHLTKSETEPSIAVALDAEKAFDRLEWPYLFKVLAKFGFGQLFISWVQTLYHKPQAKISTNGQISSTFPLSRSSRQGCPLSPALFVLAIEPLAEAIRQDPDIKGFQVGQAVHKINLLADDVILYLKDPDNSLSKLQTVLNTYSSVSGYKVNLEKSEIIPLTNFDHSELQRTSQFRWPMDGVKYLGIFVDNNLKNLYNYLPLLSKIEDDLRRWMGLPLTLIGRVNCIKMNVQPRLQYLFQSLPIPLPQSFFKALNRYVRQFLWNCKVPRISMEKLTWDYGSGGLRLPSFKNYYLASQLRFISSFFEGSDAPSWTQIGLHPLNENVCSDFIYKHNSRTVNNRTDNPILRHLIKMWYEVHKSLGLKVGLSPKTPLKQNELLPMTLDNKILDRWHHKGIQRLEDCFDKRLFMPFEHLKRKYNLSNQTFFCYLQLRSFLRANVGLEMTLPVMTDVERFLCDGNTHKFISKMYCLLLNDGPKPGVHKSRMKWESDLNVTIDEQFWTELCQNSLSTIINARYRLINYNFLHQLYLTPEKLHSFKSNLSEMCFRCDTEVGSFLHCTWLCMKVRPFWHDIGSTLTRITGVNVAVDPELCLLGNLTSIRHSLTNAQLKFIEVALCVAKKCIAVSWKSDSPLLIDRWSVEMNSCIPLEKNHLLSQKTI